jgi:chorismate mutase / prephenate dehydratase
MATERIVHFLGPEGTFAHSAAKSRFRGGERLVPGKSVLDVFEAVAEHNGHLGLVPIENSIEGSVSLTLEALVDSEGLSIVGEVVVDVEQCLIGTGPISEVRTVLSHPHALAQCKYWLRANLPGVELVTMPSTAAGAFACVGKVEHAAIGSALAAELAGLPVLQHGIQDRAHNATRFIVLGREQPEPTGKDKTSLLFDAPHERGALYRALGAFERHGINLSRIESRPMPNEMWRYIFFADLEGHIAEPAVSAALTELRAGGRKLRVLGSYPRAALPR